MSDRFISAMPRADAGCEKARELSKHLEFRQAIRRAANSHVVLHEHFGKLAQPRLSNGGKIQQTFRAAGVDGQPELAEIPDIFFRFLPVIVGIGNDGVDLTEQTNTFIFFPSVHIGLIGTSKSFLFPRR